MAACHWGFRVRVLGGALVAAAVLTGCSSVPPLGPLDQERDAASGWSVWHPVSHRFTDGSAIGRVPRDVDGIVLVDVEPLLTGDVLRPLGVRVAGPDRPLAAIQTVDSWPPADPELGDTMAMADATLDGEASWGEWGFNRGYELLVGFEVVEPGRGTVQGYRITYEHDGQIYSQVITQTLAVCAYEHGADEPDAECEYETEVRLNHGDLEFET